MKSYSYYKDIFQGKEFPLAFVDLDLLDENIKSIAQRADRKKVRIASKSIRCPEIISRILKSNPDVYQGIMAFYPDEAVWLFENGFDDILMGYPYPGEIHLTKLAQIVNKGCNLRLMIDNVNQAELASKIAQKFNIEFKVCIDMDMSTAYPGLHFGVYRSPLNTPEKVLELAQKVSNFKSLVIDSLMGYEAQIAGVGDAVPGKGLQNSVVKFLRKNSHKKLALNRANAVSMLQENGINIQLVNGGGTGSMEFTRQETCVTEITAGSGFFNSGLFDYYTNFKGQPAAAYALEITRIPKAGMFTAGGGGYIASGSVSMEKQPSPYLPQGMRLTSNEGLGEVQTPIIYSGDETLNIGSPVFFRHSKAGELCERFNSLLMVSKGNIIGEAKTYRGYGQCFM